MEIQPPMLVPSDKSLGTFLNTSSFLILWLRLITMFLKIIKVIQSFLLNPTKFLNIVHHFAAPKFRCIVESFHDFNFAIQNILL